ncbi:MAG: MarC family protein [Prevotellaceae bacterium]|jgi:multiple antibiotic resistance protein|nr:MarC family protein [Prevotellaceae bacterium]
MELHLNIQEILTAFMVLFAVIDVTGAIPIFANLSASGKHIHAGRATVLSMAIIVLFLFAGEGLLRLFGTDVASFAVAGSLILFALAVEMTLDIEVFRNTAPTGYTTLIPVVFPLVAGPGTLTTTLSLRSECHTANIIIAIVLNMAFLYFVLRKTYVVEKIIGKGGIYILRKFFGIILIAMAVRLFAANISMLLG